MAFILWPVPVVFPMKGVANTGLQAKPGVGSYVGQTSVLIRRKNTVGISADNGYQNSNPIDRRYRAQRN